MRGESDGKATRAAKICAAKRDDFVGVFLILFACLIFGVIGEAAQSVSEALQGIPQWVFVMIAIVLVLAFAGVVALFFWLRLRRRQIWLARQDLVLMPRPRCRWYLRCLRGDRGEFQPVA